MRRARRTRTCTTACSSKARCSGTRHRRSAAQAATIILDGVRADRWRILVGTDAEQLDRMVRETPEDAYEPSFMEQLRAEGVFGAMPL